MKELNKIDNNSIEKNFKEEMEIHKKLITDNIYSAIFNMLLPLLALNHPIASAIAKIIGMYIDRSNWISIIDSNNKKILTLTAELKKLEKLFENKNIIEDCKDAIVYEFHRFIQKLLAEDDEKKSSLYFNLYFNMTKPENYKDKYNIIQYYNILKRLSTPSIIWLLDMYQNESLYNVKDEQGSVKSASNIFIERYKNSNINENGLVKSCDEKYIEKLEINIEEVLELSEGEIQSLRLGYLPPRIGAPSNLIYLLDTGKNFCKAINEEN